MVDRVYRNWMRNLEKLKNEDAQSNGIFEIGSHFIAALEDHKKVSPFP